MRALISVYDKSGLEKLLPILVQKGYELISTGGSHHYIKELGYDVIAVEEITGAPEILGGRVKTLHPKIHGGLLACMDNESHIKELNDHGIKPIELVVCNLYPFTDKVKEALSFEEKIEFIDIGGPSMLRGAAKNHRFVSVLSSPGQYDEFIERLEGGNLNESYRRKLAAEVFALTAAYDSAIAKFLSGEDYPQNLTLSYEKRGELRYGENPHQRAAFYVNPSQGGFLTDLDVLWGKELSYNNYRDMEVAWELSQEFTGICAVAVKHNTPCGVALGESCQEAYQKAFDCDPVSVFGGVVAINSQVDEKTALAMNKTFLEIVMAPSFTPEALKELMKKKNLRIVLVHPAAGVEQNFMSLGGGLLVQDKDRSFIEEPVCVTKRQPSQEEKEELLFAMRVVKYVKSNAIVVSENKAARGIGGGSVNRIDAAKYALEHAPGAKVLASDAFFPFSDVVALAAQKGIKAIIQPGGSLRDQESIDLCDEMGITMLFTGMRHFKH
ncbi:MAG: bifunctional phosphoribosylaminoimidazolecarboxamide formyltransferase/IMP cyclohydrolase [Tissierellia bacterium]|nr:bifunctional phosphoribosylaminoimidazolecarboxamide formyltransferase/IMP cyclohydrolase [Tissierellia bacterium]